MNVLELTIKNMAFSFHFLCTLMCVQGLLSTVPISARA